MVLVSSSRGKLLAQVRRHFPLAPQSSAAGADDTVVSYAELLRECGRHKDLSQGRRLHDRIVAGGFHRDMYLENLVIEMYGKCGSPGDGRSVFEEMAERNVFSWNIMITAYAQNGHTDEALLLFRKMQLDGVPPNAITFMAVLNACSTPSARVQGMHVHELLAGCEFVASTATGTALLNMYGKWGDVEKARRVFDGLEWKDTITWNAMISTCAHNEHGSEAFELFKQMHLRGVKANRITFLSLVDACCTLEDLPQAKLLHQLVREAGYSDVHLSITNCLMDMYSKCGSLDDARDVFDGTSHKDVISWNTIIAAYSQNACGDEALDLFNRMLREGPDPDRITFLSVLDACTSLEQGNSIRALMIERNIKVDVVLQTVLMNMYARCGSMEDAARVFDGICFKDVVCWNSILMAYAQNGHGKEALHVLRNMDMLGYKTNRISFMAAIEACATSGNLAEGRRLHRRMVAKGYGSDLVAGSALINMYGRCKSLADAKTVFQNMPERNVVTWTALIGAFVDNERDKDATVQFRLMDQEGIKPNEVTFVCTIDACANGLALAPGILLHKRAAQDGMDSNIYVGNSLINMYGKCGRLEDAKSVFGKLQHRDLITWNALMSAYAQNGEGRRAVETYWGMINEGLRPDRVSFISILDACATLGSLSDGKAVHRQLAEAGFECVDMVVGTLVNMYGRFGRADDAKLMFDKLKRKDVISWNAVASAFTQGGKGREALKLLHGMDNEGVKPDHVTFITLLDTCADHSAILEGKQYHARAVESGFGFDIILGNALLNMYGKCGSLEEAKKVFAKMVAKNMVSWNTMIVAYAQNGHVKHTIDLFREMDLDGIFPNHVSFISILFACSHAGLLEEGRKHFQYMTGDHGIIPTAEHYGCFIDLLARTGRLADAEDLIHEMPVSPRTLDWLTLLGSSAVQESAERAERAAEHVVKLGSMEASPYVNLFNIYVTREQSSVT